MDGTRFDQWARSRVQKISRRRAVAVAGATGVTTAMSRMLPTTAQDGAVTCQMHIEALTSAGPTTGAYYSGVLEIAIGAEGIVDSGSLSFDGGPTVPVVGETGGRALDLRATFPNGAALVFTGTGENPIDQCAGALSGVFGGPELGDTGSWSIDPAQSVRTGSATAITPVAGSTVTATATPACPGIQCDATYVVDPATCDCICPPPTEACGPVCCPGGSICTDEASGSCSCPDGTELCGNSCVAVCPVQTYRDYDTCACVEGCGITSCPEGEELDPDKCLCVNICPPSNPYYCGGNCYAQEFLQCSGVCYPATDLNSNAQMCGPSCQVCPAGVPCIAGTCQCPYGYSYCPGGGCLDLSSDNNNCGSCGNPCTGGKTCQGGICQQ